MMKMVDYSWTYLHKIGRASVTETRKESSLPAEDFAKEIEKVSAILGGAGLVIERTVNAATGEESNQSWTWTRGNGKSVSSDTIKIEREYEEEEKSSSSSRILPPENALDVDRWSRYVVDQFRACMADGMEAEAAFRRAEDRAEAMMGEVRAAARDRAREYLWGSRAV